MFDRESHADKTPSPCRVTTRSKETWHGGAEAPALSKLLPACEPMTFLRLEGKYGMN